jgi:hypothetical protein
MLDAYVIEEIKRRERHRDDRPAVQIPVPPPSEQERDRAERDRGDRGVVIIDYD